MKMFLLYNKRTLRCSIVVPETKASSGEPPRVWLVSLGRIPTISRLKNGKAFLPGMTLESLNKQSAGTMFVRALRSSLDSYNFKRGDKLFTDEKSVKQIISSIESGESGLLGLYDPKMPNRLNSVAVLTTFLEKYGSTSLKLQQIRRLLKVVKLLEPWGFDRSELREMLEKKESERDSKKNTQEVQEQTSASSDDTHGGDGNAQEVEAPSESADEEAEGEGEESSDSHNGNVPSEGAESENSQQQADAPGQSGTSHEGTKGQEGESLKNPDGSGGTGGNEKGNAKGDPNTDLVTKNSDDPFHAMVGVISYPKELIAPKDKDVKSLLKALSKLFESFRGKHSESLGGRKRSPNVNKKALVHELVRQSYRVGLTYKHELKASPVIIVAADVSGSCAGISNVFVPILRRLTALNTDLVGVIHSNGKPLELFIQGNPVEKKAFSAERSKFWSNLLEDKKLNIIGALMLGDSDGIQDWGKMATVSHASVILLDSYRANLGPVRKLTETSKVFTDIEKSVKEMPWEKSHLELLKDPHFQEFYGVNSAGKAVQALRLVHKTLRRD